MLAYGLMLMSRHPAQHLIHAPRHSRLHQMLRGRLSRGLTVLQQRDGSALLAMRASLDVIVGSRTPVCLIREVG
jgi:hypothetical protein